MRSASAGLSPKLTAAQAVEKRDLPTGQILHSAGVCALPKERTWDTGIAEGEPPCVRQPWGGEIRLTMESELLQARSMYSSFSPVLKVILLCLLSPSRGRFGLPICTTTSVDPSFT
jgi:hypothetical protein